MNRHLNDGQLRAWMDGQASQVVDRHLAGCPTCQQRLDFVQVRARHVQGRIAFLAEQAVQKEASLDAVPSTQAALKRLQARITDRKEGRMFNKLSSPRLRPVWTGLVVLALLAGTLSVPQVRVWAGQFLGLFRVQQIQVVSIDPSGLSQVTGNSDLGRQMGSFISNSVKVTREPSPSQAVSSAEEAGKLAGFTVRLPQGQTPDQIVVRSGMAFQMTIDQKRAQALLDESGHKDLVLPESLDGALISADIPTSVAAAFGDCPKLDASDRQEVAVPEGPGQRYPNCTILAQIPSPTVSAPPDLDVEKLAAIALEFTGMNPQQAQAFSQSVDWTTSLVIPIPKNAASYRQVDVDGVTGTLIQRPPDEGAEYVLIWVKDGVIYAVGGLGRDTSKALEMAGQLK